MEALKCFLICKATTISDYGSLPFVVLNIVCYYSFSYRLLGDIFKKVCGEDIFMANIILGSKE